MTTTEVRLFKDIGLSSDMKRTIDFTSRLEQRMWFDSHSYTRFTNVAYNKITQLLHLPYGDDCIVKAFEEFSEYTYASVKLPSMTIYAFVMDAILVDDSTAALELAVDPIQTYMTRFSIKEAFVEVEHVDRWSKEKEVPKYNKPNPEGIDTFYKVNKKMTPEDEFNLERFGVVIITTASRYRALICPVYSPDRTNIGSEAIDADTSYDGINRHYPSWDDIVSGEVFEKMEINVEDVTGMFYSPLVPFKYGYRVDPHRGTLFFFRGMPWVYSHRQGADMCLQELYYFIQDDVRAPKVYDLSSVISRPVKPKNEALYTDTDEPALFKAPYLSRKVLSADGLLQMDIPDIILDNLNYKLYLNLMVSKGDVSGTIKLVTTDGDISYKEEAGAYSEGLSSLFMVNKITVCTNNWLTYSLTERDANRQIVKNNSWQQSLDNLTFMAYGGALVGSRGTSASDAARKGIGDVVGKAIPAMGIGAAASIATSAIDAHYAWQNMLQQETKIRNKANGINIIGTGAISPNDGLSYMSIIEMKCDDESFETARDRYYKYGYVVNKYEKPDIRSRTSFNYIMTNGCTIEGNINNKIKDEIAAIFDHGITIFHGDIVDYPKDSEGNYKNNIERCLLG